ncbi:MAG: SGNH/GDSL hydrolase family protein [Chthoniobacterales bacterium]
MASDFECFDLTKLGTSVRGGHAYVEEGRLVLQRMTPEMGRFFERTEMEKIRKRCAAGIRLVFRSNTAAIRARFRFGVHARKAFVVETIVDGVSHPVDFTEGDGTGTVWQAENSEKRERTFSIWLPLYAETEILEWALSPGASFELEATDSPRWIAIGDSITQGMSASTPARSWAAQLSRSKNLDLWNFGVGGAIMEPELASYIRGEDYAVLTIAFGTNDCFSGRPLKEYQAAYRDFFSRFVPPKDRQPRIFILGPPCRIDCPPNALGLKLEDYQRALEDVCGELPAVQYINGFSLIPEEEPYFPPGDLHPNDLGMEAFAKNLAAYFG